MMDSYEELIGVVSFSLVLAGLLLGSGLIEEIIKFIMGE